ncbi:uncharacterized protein [Rutidosis leptorrhynchoides]|uniref:uncharacterized protein n=1 Tax=Rutidosis leptorrhynchoides TaxID=125765 RepID=UPI003A98F9B9
MSWKRKHWIATVMRYLPSNIVILIVNVYAPHQENKKKVVWTQLANIALKWPGPICVLGDFNSVCCPGEILREMIDATSITNFNNFIAIASLIDQPLTNDEFTWEGPLGKFSRIDRVLANHAWVSRCPEAILQTVHSNSLDHKPIVWAKNFPIGDPNHFGSTIYGLTRKVFLEFCEARWTGYEVEGWAAFTLNKKLRLLKSDLRAWNVSQRDNDEFDLNNCLRDIKNLKEYLKTRNLTEQEIAELRS